MAAGVDNHGAQFEDVSLSGTPVPTLRPSNSITEASRKRRSGLEMREYLSIGILFLVNLLNYMDRFTIAGVLANVQEYYHINDAWEGLYRLYTRKYIMVGGLSVWISAVLASSFIPSNMFWLFILTRGIVGVGEASYSIIAPTIIADMFTSVIRSRVLMFFYFAIPVGSGLGYIVGSKVAIWMNAWQWAIRVTPPLGLLCILGIILILQEPERGKAEKDQGAEHVHNQPDSNYLQDLKYLLTNKTYILSTIGYTAVVFVTGTLSWWSPTAVDYAIADSKNQTLKEIQTTSNSALMFGVIMTIAGIVGVLAGTVLAQMWKRGRACFTGHHNPRADALICTIGSFVACPFLFLGLHLITVSMFGAWAAFFVAVTFLCLNWAINVDMLLYIVLPKKRAIATGIQILISHLFGDASGPYLIGVISDWVRGSDDSPKAHFDSLLVAFYIPTALLIVSGIAFGLAAWTLVKDKENFDISMGYKSSPGKVTIINGKGTGLENTEFDSKNV